MWRSSNFLSGGNLSHCNYHSDLDERPSSFACQVGDKDCSCGGEMKRGICVKPKRGDAVLFWSMVGVSLLFWNYF